MFDIKYIRDNPQAFDAALKRRGLEPLSAKLIALDEARRANLTTLQDAQSRRNAVSKDIGKAKGAKDVAPEARLQRDALAAKLMAEVASLKDIIAKGEEQERADNSAVEAALAVIPNLPLDEVPDGKDEKDNKEVRRWGQPTKPVESPKQHFELGEALGLMDFEAAQKISGARFVVLKGALSRLERAIAALMLDMHTAPADGPLGGYTEHQVPLLVRDQAAYGTGNLPKFAEDLFRTEYFDTDAFIKEIDRIDTSPSVNALINLVRTATVQRASEAAQRRLWLIPTAEVSLTNLVREQILDEDKLPMRLTAWTPCFRSEAGAAGRDTRGMIRQHQFSKVELVSITTPANSIAEHDRMTGCAEAVLQKLGLPYRTMLLCTGDMGFASQKTYDIEVWLPGQDAYREISSCSVCGDFQARRMSARYRPKGGSPAGPAEGGLASGKTGQPKGGTDVRHVHTLNGSGLAVGRTLIAVMENYQQPDGSIVIPDALKPYMAGLERITKG